MMIYFYHIFIIFAMNKISVLISHILTINNLLKKLKYLKKISLGQDKYTSFYNV